MLTKNFKELNKNDTGLAGGKGASLGEMTQAGIPVPPGFVVLSESFEQFIKETDLVQEIDAILHKVNHKEIHTVEAASEAIRSLILNAEMPKDITEAIDKSFKELNTKYVAVRSSATAEDGKDHAWAGQLESYLNTTEEQILIKVKLCWSSLFTPRAIFYRFEKGLDTTKISVAVVIQKMVESEVSGIAFSVHPVTEDYNQLIIEAGFGLGEAIVSGFVTPDAYVVEKEPRKILNINISTQERALYRSETHSKEHGNNEWINIPEPKASSQVLTETQILELSKIILTIENHYGFPCDIEWAYEAGKFYIVQSRPITTLSNKLLTQQTQPILNHNDYIRMFAGKSFPYLFSNVFLGYYNSLDVVSIQGDGSWICFFPKAHVEKTKAEGKKLYTSDTEYKKYKAGFDSYIETSRDYFEMVIKNDSISAEEVRRFFNYVSNIFVFYSKTEFFYTDGVDQNDMAITVKEFDELKLGGRVYLNSIFFEANGYIKTLIRKIAKQTDANEFDLLNYNIQELVELVQNGKQLNHDEVERRHTFFESKEQVLFGPQAKPLINEFFSNYMQISDVIKGTIANKGKVRGKARVLVPDAKDFDKIALAVKEMEEGEILVAETTSPDIIAACQKAAAILTNQGGQLSHAAIVSRELGIPCIIGTDKDVILNIKTGDELEVDADNGIVRILETVISRFNKDDYILSFWVQGVSVFVTDIHLDAYKELDVLYIIDQGMFKQYFTKSAYKKALDRGLVFYSDKEAFGKYKKELVEHCDKFKEFFELSIKNATELSKEIVAKFFEYTKKLCGDYTKMNFEFTDKAFQNQDKNPVIKKNLEGVGIFKDQVRAIMNTVLFESEGYTTKVFSILGKQFNLASSVFDNLTQQEIFNLFEGEHPNKLVSERQNAFVEHNEKYRFREGENAIKIIEEFREEIKSQKTLQGQVASKGVATGTVKIIPVDYGNLKRMNKEIEKMQQGDILVAETTAPELIIACKKAGAIVTDMGGLMSHAAIVSRELNIPCIIGTKIATKVFKDGDMVEVDADKGIVRIL